MDEIEVFDKLNNSEFNNYSIVVASEEDKKNYQNLDKSKEIFTFYFKYFTSAEMDNRISNKIYFSAMPFFYW